jgi:hypothetical protein
MSAQDNTNVVDKKGEFCLCCFPNNLDTMNIITNMENPCVYMNKLYPLPLGGSLFEHSQIAEEANNEIKIHIEN